MKTIGDMLRGLTACLLAAGCLTFGGCESDSVVSNTEAVVTVSAANISDCGGFAPAAHSLKRALTGDEERILWSYVASTATLTVLHENVYLNCCGERSVGAEYADGVITVDENDVAGEAGRCRCSCLIDFTVDLKGLNNSENTLDLTLTVDGSVLRSWRGTIDLAAGEGEILL